MQKLKILNKKEITKILDILRKQFGFSGKLDYAFLLSQKNKIYIVNKEIEKIELSRLRVNSYGLYIAEYRDGKIRLSMDGSQIVGKDSEKNIIELNDKDAKEWLKGYDLSYDGNLKDYVIIKYKDDFIGCGKVAENNKILNYVPKTRRLKVSD